MIFWLQHDELVCVLLQHWISLEMHCVRVLVQMEGIFELAKLFGATGVALVQRLEMRGIL